MNFIEACYRDEADDARWAYDLGESIAHFVGPAAFVMSASYTYSAEGGVQLGDVQGDRRFSSQADYVPRARTFTAQLNRPPVRDDVLELTYGSNGPGIMSTGELSRRAQQVLRPFLPWPAGDALGLFGSLDGRQGHVLSPAAPVSLTPGPRRREELLRLCEHLAVGEWMRRVRPRPAPADSEALVASFTPDGRLLDRTAQSLADAVRTRLVDAVRGMDHARCRRMKRSDAEATRLWQALIDGQYGLIESFERGGRRIVLAVRCRTTRPRLSDREHIVATRAAQGLGNKQIGAELGISASTVGVHLQSALRKLGCPGRRLLTRWLRPGSTDA